MNNYPERIIVKRFRQNQALNLENVGLVFLRREMENGTGAIVKIGDLHKGEERFIADKSKLTPFCPKDQKQ